MAPKKAREVEQSQEQTSEDVPFEAAMQRLTAIVDELESGELTLEESLARFEEGVLLAKVSQRKLDEAEAKVELLLAVRADGEPETEELDEP